MSKNQDCFYHPKVIAVDSCERCHKLICLSDKRTLTTNYSSNNNYSYSTKSLFCPPYYYEAYETGFKLFNKYMNIVKPFTFIFMV